MDEIDQKILSKLRVDGRTTLKDLAKITGYTSMGIKKRLSNLLERDVAQISSLLNLESLSMSAAIVMMEMDSTDAIQKLLDRFQKCPRVVYIFRTLGGFNLIGLVVAEDYDTLESISVEKCSLRSGKGIRRSEFYPIGQICYSQFLPIREELTHKNRTRTPCGLHCKPCHRYETEKCVGCPATVFYKGQL
jgi:Lrp/AsnC family leucine-responsive transcriptional regulator